MSIFEVDCAQLASASICAHIAAFYPSVAGDPPVMCIFSDTELPAGYTMQHTLSDTNDECHREVFAGNGPLKNMRDRPLDAYTICDGGVLRALTVADVQSWAAP